MVSNALLIIGVVMCLFTNYPLFCVGKFFCGLGAGLFSLFGPKYNSQFAPVEISGPLGTFTQLSITLGLLVADMLGVFFPNPEDYTKGKNKFISDFI